MRKVTSILIMLVSVLTMWGQSTKFTYEAASNAITQLKDAQPKIIQQANASSRIVQTDKENAEGLLTATFQKLDKVMSVYKQIESDPQLTQEAQQIIDEFLNAFRSAILDDKKENIQVSTRSFMTVAENSSKQFDEFYSKAQKYIEMHPSASTTEADVSDAQDSAKNNDEDLEPQDNGTISETIKKVLCHLS